MYERELQLVRAFVVPAKRERYAEFLAASTRRPKFLRELDHFHDLDPSRVVPLVGTLDRSSELLAELRRRGAPETCHLISCNRKLDGETLPLPDAIARVYSGGFGTFVGCIAGVLAYYEGEARGHRFILDAR